MKVSNILNKIPESGYKSRLLSYPVVYVCTVVILIYIANSISVEYPDSETYMSAAERLLHGLPDVQRTPVYPAILACARILFGEGAWVKIFVYCLQTTVFLFSGVAMQQICQKLSGSVRISFWITTAYLLIGAISGFPVLILTDSLAMSGSMLLIWLLMHRYPSLPTRRDIILVSLLLTVLIFLRPFFVYLIPVLLIYYGTVWNSSKGQFKKVAIVGIAGLIAAVGCVQAYRYVMQRSFGISSMCVIPAINNYYTVRLIAQDDPELTDDSQLKACIDSLSQIAPQLRSIEEDRFALYDASTPVAFEQYVNQLMKTHPKECLVSIYDRTARIFLLDEVPALPVWYGEFPGWKTILCHTPNFFTVFIFGIIFIIGWAKVWYRSKRLPYNSLLLILIEGGGIILSVIGAQAEWSRLSMSGFPALLLMVGMAASTVSISLSRFVTNAQS